MRNYYDKKYFDYQKKAGLYGAQQDLWLYQEYIKPTDKILDFGCGGGFMLEKLKAKRKYGIEINNFARNEAAKRGIKVFKDIKNLPVGIRFDTIIMHHTLEHLMEPYSTLVRLKKILKNSGKLICVVPIDDWTKEKEFILKDLNKHLYTWTPLLLGNLFYVCGYKVRKVNIVNRFWLPLSRYYYDQIPRNIYNLFSYLWSFIVSSRQIRIVVTKQ